MGETLSSAQAELASKPFLGTSKPFRRPPPLLAPNFGAYCRGRPWQGRRPGKDTIHSAATHAPCRTRIQRPW